MTNSKVPPFIDEERERLIRERRESVASYFVMAFGWAGMTIALVGGAYLIYSYLTRDPNPPIAAPLTALGLIYLAGWGVSLASVRAFYNLVMPIVIRVYSFGVLAGILFVYIRGILKIFRYQAGDPPDNLPGNQYLFILIAGYLLLLSLYLLVSNFSLTPHAIVLFIAAFGHLVVMVSHYVFIGSESKGLITFDIYLLVAILLIAILLLARGLYRPIKGTIASRFREKLR